MAHLFIMVKEKKEYKKNQVRVEPVSAMRTPSCTDLQPVKFSPGEDEVVVAGSVLK